MNPTTVMIPTTICQKPMSEGEELELEIVDELYPWAKSKGEKRRCFIFEYFGWNNDIDAKIQIEAIRLIEKCLLGQ